MNRVLIAAAAMALGMAGAQTWEGEGFRTTFQGCVDRNGGVTCNLSVSYTGSRDVENVTFCMDNMAVITSAGGTIKASTKSFAGGRDLTTCDSVDIY